MNRRQFLGLAVAGAAGSVLPGFAARAAGTTHLVILHTSDTHSRIDPFPMDGSRNQGLGGVARRAALIKKIRAENPNVLLLDSGDIFQGTPYFNFFGGEIEFKAMSAMRYDAATLGNHDFDNGVAGFVRMLPQASFPFVNANYDFGNSALAPHMKPWLMFEKGGAKIGVFGLGIDFEGLVLPALHEGITYTDPIEAARRTEAELRRRGANLVVCLSHLGYDGGDGDPGDVDLARQVPGLDLILGGHTHKFLAKPEVYTSGAHETLVSHVGWGGIWLGRIDVVIGADGQVRDWQAQHYPVTSEMEEDLV